MGYFPAVVHAIEVGIAALGERLQLKLGQVVEIVVAGVEGGIVEVIFVKPVQAFVVLCNCLRCIKEIMPPNVKR